jgi:ABC-2 type transport system permease protein
MPHRLALDARLYLRLVWMQIRSQAQYKVGLVIDVVTYFFVTALEFASLLIFFGPFPTLLGWRVGEVALLFAVTSLAFGLAELVGAGIDGFPDMIRRGDFDRLLLRPTSALLQVATSDFRLRRLGRITQGAVGFALALALLRGGLHWTPAKVALVPLAVLSGGGIFVSILLFGATLCFWTVETTELTNVLTYGGREMLSYPLTIYSGALQRLFVFVVPLAFGTFLPVCYLLDRPLPFGLPAGLVFAAPLVAAAFAFASGALWRLGVRHYQSTGS